MQTCQHLLNSLLSAIMGITIQKSLGDSVPDVMTVINLVIQLTRISGINLFGKPIE